MDVPPSVKLNQQLAAMTTDRDHAKRQLSKESLARFTLQARVTALEKALKSCKAFIIKNKRGNEYLWMEGIIEHALTPPAKEA